MGCTDISGLHSCMHVLASLRLKAFASVCQVLQTSHWPVTCLDRKPLEAHQHDAAGHILTHSSHVSSNMQNACAVASKLQHPHIDVETTAHLEVHVCSKRNLARVHFQYGLPCCTVRWRHIQQAVKAPRSEQSTVHTVWSVGCSHHNNSNTRLQTPLTLLVFFGLRSSAASSCMSALQMSIAVSRSL